MAGTPRVSVLMTVYNGLPFLSEAVESVLRQTLRDFELVIVDDASTDGSHELLQRYNDRRIRVYRNECNHGQAWSLRRGLELCRAAYVARLDQDDVCLPRRFEQQAALLDQRPGVAIVGTFMIAVDGQGRHTGIVGRRMENYGTFVASLLLGLCPVCHPSVMYRRETIIRVGGYDESFAPAEDVELWTRVALHRSEAAVIPTPLGLNRTHAAQQSVTKAEAQQRNIWRAQQQLLAAWCAPEAADAVGLFLRKDTALWTHCASRASWHVVFHAMHEMMATLKLSPSERAAFLRVMDRHVGLSLRVGPQITRWPSAVFYPALGCLSPILFPRIRQLLARGAALGRRWSTPFTLRRSLMTHGLHAR